MGNQRMVVTGKVVRQGRGGACPGSRPGTGTEHPVQNNQEAITMVVLPSTPLAPLWDSES